jgi:hypothetical protein
VRARVIHTVDVTLPLVRFVYTRCLLDIPNEINPSGSLCKSIQSRPAAYALLHELAIQSVVRLIPHSAHNCLQSSFIRHTYVLSLSLQ